MIHLVPDLPLALDPAWRAGLWLAGALSLYCALCFGGAGIRARRTGRRGWPAFAALFVASQVGWWLIMASVLL
jgi:hypothetical protein